MAIRTRGQRPGVTEGSVVASGVDDLAAMVEVDRRDVVAQVGSAGLLVLGQGRGAQGVVATTHAALGMGLAVQVNWHGMSLQSEAMMNQDAPLSSLSSS